METADRLPDYTAVMSVYAGEQPGFLRESLESMLAQTHPCRELILVCDGKLTDELDRVISELCAKHPGVMRVVRASKQLGVGACANAALRRAGTDYIVKMDSDDIALPDRCEKQLAYLSEHEEIDMLGAYIEEFDSDSGQAIALRRTPVSDEEIRKYAKRRNPFNNQTLIYRKAAAIRSGGYSTVRRCEDYEFAVRMLMSGARGANLPEVLVRYRVTESNLTRRRNIRNTVSFIAVRWHIHREGFSSLVDFLIPCAAQLMLFMLPAKLTGLIYKKLLRK